MTMTMMMFRCAVLGSLLPVLTWGQGAVVPLGEGRWFEIREGGVRRSFVLALDELAERRGDGAEGLARLGVRGGGLAAMRELAGRREAVTGERQDVVLYEGGRLRDGFSRRVVTREVLVEVGAGFDVVGAGRAIGAVRFERPDFARGSVIFTVGGAGEALTVVEVLRGLPGVLSAEPLLARVRERRLIPNDAFFSYNAANGGYQWHLRNTGQSPGTLGVDARVTPVWDSYTGAGVRIGIVDDGLEVGHPDLSPNVDAVNDYDWNDGTPNDPTGNPSSDTHGTACAGVAGARGNNGTGVSGAAPGATLVGLRLIAGSISDADEAEALSWRGDLIEVYSNSWGPNDDGRDLRDAGSLVKQALADGAVSGRGGRGSIWVWAGGNGGDVQDNSNYDGYANSIYTLAVGAVNDGGVRSAYSEPGANLHVVAPSNDNVGFHRGITTTTTNGGYTFSFGGTSSATPLVAGVVALMLECRPTLGWRDVMEVLMRSARKVDAGDGDWIDNGGGFHFNHDYGAGMIDAEAAVALASGWSNLGPQTTHAVAQTGLSVAIPDANATGISRTLTVPGTVAMRVEQATLRVTATHGRRGDLEVTLISPFGTESRLFEAHTRDSNLNLSWTFSSVRHWGESAAGNWTVRVRDRAAGTAGTLTGLTLTLYGADAAPATAVPAITSALSAGGSVGSSFSYDITASNNPQTLGASGLPGGLSVNANGQIRGVPTVEGVFAVGLSATNGLGTGVATLVLSVGPRVPTPPVITSAATAAGVLNVPFAYQITATQAPTSFSATGLPGGVAVNGATGLISGTPTVSGVFPVMLTATNGDGAATQVLTLTVTNAATVLAQALDAPQLIFTTGGDVPWVAPATDNHDGVDAAESGNVGDNQQSWLETTVRGPVYVTFWFRLSSEFGYDFFRFSIDGEELWYSDGEHAWRRLGFFVDEGLHTLRWNYTKDDIVSSGADRLWIDEVEVYDSQAMIADVVDNPNLTWSMPGVGEWPLQDRRTVDGEDAFISPIFLGDGRSSSIETVVMGPGSVSFWWTISSELNADFFRFEIDDAIVAQISGNAGGNNIPWAQRTVAVPAGLHTLRWRYVKDAVGFDGLDACWLDTIQYTPSFASGPPYAQWLMTQFAANDLGNGLVTGPSVDREGDGRSNLEEYAFGGSAVVADEVEAVTFEVEPTTMDFLFSTDVTKTDLSVLPMVSDGLGTWDPATADFVSESGTERNWRVRVPLSAGRKFLQLRATLVAP